MSTVGGGDMDSPYGVRILSYYYTTLLLLLILL